MDFETRQKLAIDEMNAIMKKYGVAMQTFLNVQQTGITPLVRLVDIEPKEVEAGEGNVSDVKTEVINDTKNVKTKKAKAVKAKKPAKKSK